MTITDTPITVENFMAIKELAAHPQNLRHDLGDLSGLVASIKSVGIIQPLTVDNDGTVIDGHRRLAAARKAGLKHVPVYRMGTTDEATATEIMLISALQRANLNPIEEGTGFARLAQLGLSQREIAERVGCNQSHVSKRIKLTTIPADARTLVATGELDIHDALQLAALVELDANSADEWVVDALGRGVKQAWPGLAERIRRATGDQRRVAAEAEGKASGLKVMRNSDRLVDFDECDRESATNWIVSVHGDLVWLARRPETPEAAPINPTKERASDRPKPKPVPGVDHSPEGEAAIEAANAELAAMCEATEDDDELARVLAGRDADADVFWDAVIARFGNLSYGQDIEPDVDVVLTAEHEVTLRSAEELRVYLLYGELPEEFDGPTTVEEVEKAKAMVAETIALIEAEEAHAESTTMEEAEAQAFAEDAGAEWDQQRTTPPWKAYAFTNETKTIGGIREHKNPAKLRWAEVYEMANKNRPMVLAAITERLAELGESA